MQDDRQRPQPARRQNGMSRRALENGFSTISVLILMLLMVIGVGFLIFFPRSKQSVIEKRELTTFPSFSFASYFSGEFTAGVTKWYDDTVPYRDDFKNMGNNIKGLFGITTNDTAIIIGLLRITVVQASLKPQNQTQQARVIPLQQARVRKLLKKTRRTSDKKRLRAVTKTVCSL